MKNNASTVIRRSKVFGVDLLDERMPMMMMESVMFRVCVVQIPYDLVFRLIECFEFNVCSLWSCLVKGPESVLSMFYSSSYILQGQTSLDCQISLTSLFFSWEFEGVLR